MSARSQIVGRSDLEERYAEALTIAGDETTRTPPDLAARGHHAIARILLLDEPTSALASDEVDALFSIIGSLKACGIGIIYVSHHLSEVIRLADRITVPRDGRWIETHMTRDTSEKDVVSKMVGRLVVTVHDKSARATRGDRLYCRPCRPAGDL